MNTEIKQCTHIIYPKHHNKPIVIDTRYVPGMTKQPIVVFCHGYKGFKDWGAWNLVAAAFANAGFFFVKFNFSHNGGTVEEPIDFPDLEAFGCNNYVTEVEDLHSVLDWVTSPKTEHTQPINSTQISVIGHSRGGGIASIVASETTKVQQLITWAGVSDYKSRFPKGDAFKQWQKDGVYTVVNGRTKQEMPHYFQYYTSFMEYEDRLTIQKAVQKIQVPHLILHGTEDISVPIQNAIDMYTWNPKARLLKIKDANHVFGATHPWEHLELPAVLHKVVEETIGFIRRSTLDS